MPKTKKAENFLRPEKKQLPGMLSFMKQLRIVSLTGLAAGRPFKSLLCATPFRAETRLPVGSAMKKNHSPLTVIIVIIFCFFALAIMLFAFRQGRPTTGSRPRPIPHWILYPSEGVKVLRNALFKNQDLHPPDCEEFRRFHPIDYSRPIAHAAVPQHPFLAANPGSNMHCDAYMSDTYERAGPQGVNLQVLSRTQGFGGYGTLAYGRSRRLIAVYSNGRGFQLELMDPYTLEELASYDLPSRPWYFFFQGVLPWKYIGAGMYFFLDHQDRAVVPTTKNTILVVQAPDSADQAFKLIREYDLRKHVVPLGWPAEDSIAWVLPEWSGLYYWVATTRGMVGTVNVDSGAVSSIRLQEEVIENSFAVGEEGLFIISDQALYRFSRNQNGNIAVDWRTEYDQGGRAKAGHITRGSGSSVTLMGGANGLVAITDNAEPRINLLFIRRSDGRQVCSLPLFEEDKSGTDLTVIGFEQAGEQGEGVGVYSVIVENNWGNHHFPQSNPVPGLTRVDAKRNDNGTYSCREIWTSQEKSIGGFRLSFGNGLVYMYGRSEVCPVTQWYFIAIDFATGETVYKRLTGKGLGYNNWQGSLFLHPDGGTAYSTTIFGLVMVQDDSGQKRQRAGRRQ